MSMGKSSGMMGGSFHQEVSMFLSMANLDERAVSEFMSCPAEVQAQVMSRGELASARNPSATLSTRIRDARSATSEGMKGSKQGTVGQSRGGAAYEAQMFL